ncbi:hypothetical protein [Rhodococcus pyridinivorans]
MTQSQWGDETIRRIAEAIRSARGKRSVQWVADRTAELGHPISRAAISNLEVGRKAGVDITELIVLARALEIAPVMLVYPDLMDGPTEVVPGQVVTAFEAYKWFTGEWVPNTDVTPQRPEPGNEDSKLPQHENWRYLNAVQPVDLARAYSDTGFKLRSLVSLLAKQPDDELAGLITRYEKDLADLRRRMLDLGMVVEDE